MSEPVLCDRCGLSWPPDPKHPGYPELHACGGDPVDYRALADTLQAQLEEAQRKAEIDEADIRHWQDELLKMREVADALTRALEEAEAELQRVASESKNERDLTAIITITDALAQAHAAGLGELQDH